MLVLTIRNELLICKGLYKCTQSFIDGFDTLSELRFQTIGDLHQTGLAVASFPYKGSEIVQVDLKMRIHAQFPDDTEDEFIPQFRFPETDRSIFLLLPFHTGDGNEIEQVVARILIYHDGAVSR